MTFSAEVWEHTSGGWHFLDVPEAVADDIEARYGERAGGFGSVRVEVTVGASRWRTSLFPDAKRATYVLPLKKPVRAAEGFGAGDTVTVQLAVVH